MGMILKYGIFSNDMKDEYFCDHLPLWLGWS